MGGTLSSAVACDFNGRQVGEDRVVSVAFDLALAVTTGPVSTSHDRRPDGYFTQFVQFSAVNNTDQPQHLDARFVCQI